MPGCLIVNVQEVAGLTATDASSHHASSGSTAATTNATATLAQAVEFAAACLVWDHSATTISALTAGFTSDSTVTSAGGDANGTAFQHGYQITAATTALTYAGTLSVSRPNAGSIATFKGASISSVQSVTVASPGPGGYMVGQLAVAIASSGANTLIACIGGSAGGASANAQKVVGVVDNLGQVWLPADVSGANVMDTEVWYSPIPGLAGVTTVTVILDKNEVALWGGAPYLALTT
jgi:hypothetical protein